MDLDGPPMSAMIWEWSTGRGGSFAMWCVAGRSRARPWMRVERSASRWVTVLGFLDFGSGGGSFGPGVVETVSRVERSLEKEGGCRVGRVSTARGPWRCCESWV